MKTVTLTNVVDGSRRELKIDESLKVGDRFRDIAAAIPTAKPEEVRNYLDSAYGRHTADEVLNGTPVARRVEFRRARLVRHFAEIQRQTARGAFED